MNRLNIPFSRLAKAAPWLPVLLPPVLVVSLMRAYLLNVPFMDDYVYLPLYEKIVRGDFHFGDFFFVQMEHRATVPCFLVWLCHHLSPGRITLQNWISFGMICLTIWNLAFVLRRTAGRLQLEWLLVALSAWIFFSPVQCYTLLWPDCFDVFFPATFLSSAMALFFSRLKLWPKLAACALCVVAGTHSFASSFLIWLLIPPLVLWTEGLPDASSRRKFLVGWAIVCGITTAMYFHNLVNQAEAVFSYAQGQEVDHGGHLSVFLRDPIASARFILMFTGSLLGRGTFASLQSATLIAGLTLAGVIIGAGAYLWTRRDDGPLRQTLLPWLMLGLYSAGTGTMVAIGRIWSTPGLEGALWNRYTPHAAPITFAACVLVFLVGRDLILTKKIPDSRAHAAGAALLASMIVLIVMAWVYGARQMNAWWSSRLRDASCNLFARALPDSSIHGPLTGNLNLAMRMDDIGLLRPPMLKDARLDNFRIRPTGLSIRWGELEEVRSLGAGKLEAQGFAFLQHRTRVADAILLTFQDDTGHWIIFGVGQAEDRPLYLQSVLDIDGQYLHQPDRSKRRAYGGFRFKFDVPQFPSGERLIAAWALDFPSQSVHRIFGQFHARADTGGILEVVPESAR